ncbi:uncharacterized protein [Ptychodera flava]|uniref:uncharacterized protein n=1 Tax=Ptychodera flava TaxID=63121 RepID=UPI00396A1835
MPERCIVRLYERYNQLCPSDRPDGAYYLYPLSKPTTICWYTNRPLGHNALNGTVARMCKQAGIDGYRSNHSLRATAATRLFDANVDEQLICEKTGHRSNAVRSYKRTSDRQQQNISRILQGHVGEPPKKLACIQPTSQSIAKREDAQVSSDSQRQSEVEVRRAAEAFESPPSTSASLPSIISQ